MSVIGLMLVLTHRSMRCKSFQAALESTTSRGADGLVLHSGSYSTQNSIQPIGGRATAPTAMNSGRSSAVPALGAANSDTATNAAVAPCLRMFFTPVFIVTPSHLVRGHVSHKAFAGRLSCIVPFEVKALQQ